MQQLGLSNQGQRHTDECAFSAGTLWDAPLKISYFLVILFIYNLVEAVQMESYIFPIWYVVCSTTLKQIVLLVTILCHEFGHGKMATYLGGKIEQILLWPFGGICFSSAPASVTDNQKMIANDLRIATAGPATHFFQTPIWLAIFIGLRQVIPHADYGSASWEYLIPFSRPAGPFWCIGGQVREHCIESLGGWLLFDLASYAVQINVLLFLFNVFFPMYPLDGSKIITSTLLWCGVSAVIAAKVIILLSVPLAIYFLYSAFSSTSRGAVGTGIMAYLGFMCLMETYKIYNLLATQQLHHHPLFRSAESNTLSTEHREAYATHQFSSSHVTFQPFSADGQRLDSTQSSNRGAFLDRLENQQVQNSLSAKDLRQSKNSGDRRV